MFGFDVYYVKKHYSDFYISDNKEELQNWQKKFTITYNEFINHGDLPKKLEDMEDDEIRKISKNKIDGILEALRSGNMLD